MKPQKCPSSKHIPEDIGGRSIRVAPSPAPQPEDAEVELVAELYPLPQPQPMRRHNPHATSQRLKAKRIAEAKLLQISEDLSQLAERIRYLNPLMAATIDEALTATEEAIDFLETDKAW